ncbi:MAG: SRPBCC domain-containing protein [Stappiaceae bacterium]
MTKTTTISKTVFFNAGRETVWAFLTDKDKLGAWYHPARADLKQGEKYELIKKTDDSGQPIIWGKVLTMDPPSKLVTTFVIGPFDGAETTVTWILEEAAGGTRLSLTHEGIAEATGPAAMQLLMALDDGWDEHLGSLRKAAAA